MEIDKKGGLVFGYNVIDATLQKPLEQGGPAEAGKTLYGWRSWTRNNDPHSSGNVVANDDAQVFSMLLASITIIKEYLRKSYENLKS